MLNAINKPKDSFTSGDYNILRVIAAYPQDALLTNPRKTVQAALDADKHPIATMKHVPLSASLALDPEYPPALQFLDESLALVTAKWRKRKRKSSQVESPKP